MAVDRFAKRQAATLRWNSGNGDQPGEGSAGRSLGCKTPLWVLINVMIVLMLRPRVVRIEPRRDFKGFFFSSGFIRTLFYHFNLHVCQAVRGGWGDQLLPRWKKQGGERGLIYGWFIIYRPLSSPPVLPPLCPHLPHALLTTKSSIKMRKFDWF